MGTNFNTWLAKTAQRGLEFNRFMPLTNSDLELIKELRNKGLELATILVSEKKPSWLLGWRDICRATDMRTMIPSIVNLQGIGGGYNLIYFDHFKKSPHHLVAEFSSLIFDYVTRQKIGGTHLNQLYLKQLPLLDTTKISAAEDAALLKAVLELTYTSNILRHWAEDPRTLWQSVCI